MPKQFLVLNRYYRTRLFWHPFVSCKTIDSRSHKIEGIRLSLKYKLFYITLMNK